MTRKKIKCKECGKEFSAQTFNGIVRSKLCPTCNYKKAISPKKKAPKFVKNVKGNQRSKKSLTKDLDQAWSYLVKLRAGNKCEYCGETKALNSHHLFSRAKMSVRWDVKNGICLCVNHHIGVKFSAHKTPLSFDRWLLKRKGEQELDLLEVSANQIKKWEVFEMEILLSELKKEIDKFEKK